MGKCDNCEIKKWYARVVDYHIFDERDCPYECKEEQRRIKTMSKTKTEAKLKYTNEYRLKAMSTRELARELAAVAGYNGNPEEVAFWEHWLREEAENE